MKELILPSELSCEIGEIYDSMAIAYEEVAGQVSLTCEGCPDNCCDSFFLHYTYVEWAYLWEGIRGLEDRAPRSHHAEGSGLCGEEQGIHGQG